jgi:hypothetical protein
MIISLTQRIYLIRCVKYKNSNWMFREILLVLKIFVECDEGVEIIFYQFL